MSICLRDRPEFIPKELTVNQLYDLAKYINTNKNRYFTINFNLEEMNDSEYNLCP